MPPATTQASALPPTRTATSSHILETAIIRAGHSKQHSQRERRRKRPVALRSEIQWAGPMHKVDRPAVGVRRSLTIRVVWPWFNNEFV